MKTVLIVDDNDVDIFVNRMLLERIKTVRQIHTATNGEEAILLLKDHFQKINTLPDIILLDLNMPVMDGFTFIEKFKALELPEKERVTIVILTSSSSFADITEAKEKGVNYYITKPLTENKLLSALGNENY
jgi:CheY-like chemotaxis protein